MTVNSNKIVSVDALKINAISVNRKAVVRKDRNRFGTAPVFLAVVSVFVVTGTSGGFRLTERAAIFLASSSVI